MKSVSLAIPLIVLFPFTCKTQHQPDVEKAVSVQDQNAETIYYSEKELAHFLDSVASLDLDLWTIAISFKADSTLNSHTHLHDAISNTDFEKLKAGCEKGLLNVEVAQHLFPQLGTDFSYRDFVNEANELPINLYSFGKADKFDEYAVSIGYDKGLAWGNTVYFFKKNMAIAKHQIFHRYGLELKHFKNEKNETILYYKVNYGSGSGIWWHQFNFYKYDNDTIIPVLTEIQNINLKFPWSIRAYWIESTVLNTNPLTLKFVYVDELLDTVSYHPVTIAKDSTIVKYTWNQSTRKYQAVFTDQKLNKHKLLTYYFADNELLFINSNQDLLKSIINGQDQVKRVAALNYLNDVKNEHTRRQQNE